MTEQMTEANLVNLDKKLSQLATQNGVKQKRN